MSDEYVPPSNPVARTGAGIVGGLAGGIVLGGFLQVMGEVEPIGKLAGSSTTSGSWLVLLTICLVAGALYGGLFGAWVSRTGVIYAKFGPRRRYYHSPRRTWGLVYAVPGVRPRRRRRKDDD
ncbi:MAG: hypothetical protein FWJ93_11775 [Micromonosporaceae bacterium]